MDFVVRLNRPDERDRILAFIEELEFTVRHPETWDGLGMIAATCWLGDRLVGAIPMEPRQLFVGGRVLSCVQETVVGVHPDFRGRGLGSAMQRLIADERPVGAEIVAVFREESTVGAYKWYLTNEFSSVMRVWSWSTETPPAGSSSLGMIVPAEDPGLTWDRIEAFRQADANGHHGCWVARETRPLAPWLAVHPYGGYYRYSVAWSEDSSGCLDGYAIIGCGRLHSQTERIEILEFAAADTRAAHKVLNVVLAYAAARDLKPLRWMLAAGDRQFEALAGELGLTSRFSIDLLVRPLIDGLSACLFGGAGSRFHGIDYI